MEDHLSVQKSHIVILHLFRYSILGQNGQQHGNVQFKSLIVAQDT